MKINRQNYEIFFIDYIDGALSREQEAALQVFLKNNIDLKEELDSLLEEETVKMIPPDNEYSLPQALKANASLPAAMDYQNYIKFFIAFYENDLTANQKNALARFLNKHKVLQKEFEAYGGLKLQSDKKIHYNNINQLKKKSRKLPLYYQIAIAAGLLLLFSLLFLDGNISNNNLKHTNITGIEVIDQDTQVDERLSVTLNKATSSQQQADTFISDDKPIETHLALGPNAAKSVSQKQESIKSKTINNSIIISHDSDSIFLQDDIPDLVRENIEKADRTSIALKENIFNEDTAIVNKESISDIAALPIDETDNSINAKKIPEKYKAGRNRLSLLKVGMKLLGSITHQDTEVKQTLTSEGNTKKLHISIGDMALNIKKSDP